MILTALLLFVLIPHEALSEISEEDGVLVLTNETFAEGLDTYQHLLVEFYAPWCGHCKALEPEYSKAAAQLLAENSPIRLAKVDSTLYEDLARDYSIQGFPTIKLFSKGKQPLDFNGDRRTEGIVAWLKKKTGPPAVTISSSAQLNKLKEEEVTVVGFFKDINSKDAEIFLKVAQQFESIVFGITSDDALFGENNIVGNSSVVMFKKFDEKRSDNFGEIHDEALTAFVKINSVPLVAEFTQDKAQEIFGGEIKAHLLFFLPKSSPAYQTTMENARKVALFHRSQVMFVFIDTDDEENQRLADFFSIKKEQLPTYRLASFANNEIKKFKPETDEMSEEALGMFMNLFHSGDIKPFLLTEEVPADWDAKPVKVLVGHNYNEVTKGSKKKVLVEIYAPWCGHCKQLVPIWDELGEMYKDNANVIIAKFDATANEVDGLQILSYPTIKLYLPSAEKEIDFYGSRTLEGFAKFVDTDGEEGRAPTPEELKAQEEEMAAAKEASEASDNADAEDGNVQQDEAYDGEHEDEHEDEHNHEHEHDHEDDHEHQHEEL